MNNLKILSRYEFVRARAAPPAPGASVHFIAKGRCKAIGPCRPPLAHNTVKSHMETCVVSITHFNAAYSPLQHRRPKPSNRNEPCTEALKPETVNPHSQR